MLHLRICLKQILSDIELYLELALGGEKKTKKKTTGLKNSYLGFLKLFVQCGHWLACLFSNSTTSPRISLTRLLSLADSMSSFSDSCMPTLRLVLLSLSACSSLICTRFVDRVRLFKLVSGAELGSKNTVWEHI